MRKQVVAPNMISSLSDIRKEVRDEADAVEALRKRVKAGKPAESDLPREVKYH